MTVRLSPSVMTSPRIEKVSSLVAGSWVSSQEPLR